MMLLLFNEIKQNHYRKSKGRFSKEVRKLINFNKIASDWIENNNQRDVLECWVYWLRIHEIDKKSILRKKFSSFGWVISIFRIRGVLQSNSLCRRSYPTTNENLQIIIWSNSKVWIKT